MWLLEIHFGAEARWHTHTPRLRHMHRLPQRGTIFVSRNPALRQVDWKFDIHAEMQTTACREQHRIVLCSHGMTELEKMLINSKSCMLATMWKQCWRNMYFNPHKPKTKHHESLCNVTHRPRLRVFTYPCRRTRNTYGTHEKHTRIQHKHTTCTRTHTDHVHWTHKKHKLIAQEAHKHTQEHTRNTHAQETHKTQIGTQKNRTIHEHKRIIHSQKRTRHAQTRTRSA